MHRGYWGNVFLLSVVGLRADALVGHIAPSHGAVLHPNSLLESLRPPRLAWSCLWVLTSWRKPLVPLLEPLVWLDATMLTLVLGILCLRREGLLLVGSSWMLLHTAWHVSHWLVLAEAPLGLMAELLLRRHTRLLWHIVLSTLLTEVRWHLASLMITYGLLLAKAALLSGMLSCTVERLLRREPGWRAWPVPVVIAILVILPHLETVDAIARLSPEVSSDGVGLLLGLGLGLSVLGGLVQTEPFFVLVLLSLVLARVSAVTPAAAAMTPSSILPKVLLCKVGRDFHPLDRLVELFQLIAIGFRVLFLVLELLLGVLDLILDLCGQPCFLIGHGLGVQLQVAYPARCLFLGDPCIFTVFCAGPRGYDVVALVVDSRCISIFLDSPNHVRRQCVAGFVLTGHSGSKITYLGPWLCTALQSIVDHGSSATSGTALG